MTRVIYKTIEGKQLLDTTLEIIPNVGDLFFTDSEEDKIYQIGCIMHGHRDNENMIIILVKEKHCNDILFI